MFWDNYLQLCIQKNKTPTAIGIELGFSRATVSNWKNGGIPRETALHKIAVYFGVSIDYLLGKSETPSTAAISFTAEENAIISALRAQPEMKPAVLRLLGLDSGSE